jgi:hypothetical protein
MDMRESWDGTELTVVGGNLTINDTGVTIAATTGGTYANDRAYRFSTAISGTSLFGTYADGNGTDTSVKTYCTGSGAITRTAELHASYGSGSASVSCVADGITSTNKVHVSGILNVDTFGEHQISATGTGANALNIKNTSTAGNDDARLLINSGSTSFKIIGYNQGNGTSGSIVTSGCLVLAEGVGGLSIQSSAASSELRFYTGGTQRARFDTNGDFVPGSSNTQHLGVTGAKWIDVWAVNGTIQTSDADVKDDIRPTDLGKDFLLALTPVAWRWKDGSDDRDHHGFTAQDVAAATGGRKFGGLYRDENGKPSGLNYSSFIAPLVSGFQDHHTELGRLTSELAMLRAELAELKGK